MGGSTASHGTLWTVSDDLAPGDLESTCELCLGAHVWRCLAGDNSSAVVVDDS